MEETKNNVSNAPLLGLLLLYFAALCDQPQGHLVVDSQLAKDDEVVKCRLRINPSPYAATRRIRAGCQLQVPFMFISTPV